MESQKSSLREKRRVSDRRKRGTFCGNGKMRRAERKKKKKKKKKKKCKVATVREDEDEVPAVGRSRCSIIGVTTLGGTFTCQ